MKIADADRVLQFMRLIWAVDHELERCSKRMEATHGLTVGQRMTLLLLDRYPEASATELASLMHVHPGTMSGMLKRLAAAGFIARRSHQDDARRFVLSLTPKGVAANRRREGTFESAAHDVLRTHAANEVRATERVLAGLSARLSEDTPREKPRRAERSQIEPASRIVAGRRVNRPSARPTAPTSSC